MAHPNEQFLRETYDKFQAGGIGSVMDRLSDDIVWRIPGRSLVAGEYKGKYEVNQFFAKLMEISKGSFELLDVDDIVAGDRHAAVFVGNTARRNGDAQKMNTVHLWTIDERGKLSEFKRLPDDTYADDEFWS